MKNLKFNFKSIVRSKARWLLTLIAILTLGVGQMWADTGTYSIYVAPKELWGNNWSDANKHVRLNFCPGKSYGNWTWWTWTMGWCGAYNANGNKIYKYGPFTDWNKGSNGLGFIRANTSDVQDDGGYYEVINEGGWWTDAGYANKVYYGYSSSTHHWESYDTYAVSLVQDGYIYFDNSAGDLSGTYKYFAVGHNSHTDVFKMTRLNNNTNIWYVYLSGADWKDANYCAFFSSSSGTWSGGDWGSSQFSSESHTPNLTIDFSNNRINSGKYYLYKGSNSTLTRGAECNSAAAALNLSQTIDVRVSTNRGSSYSDDASWTSGYATAARYYASAYNTVSYASATALSSSTTSTSAIKTSTVTFTAVPNTGYTFRGWNTTTTGPSGGTGTKAYTVIGATTTYAYFERNHYSITYSPSSPVAGDYFSWDTKPTDGDYGTEVTFSITPTTGYVMATGYPQVNDGSAVSVTDNGDNSYTFTMRNAAPTITVSMVPADVDLHIGIYDATSHGSMQAGDGAKASLPSPYLTDSTVEYNSSITFTASPYLGYQVKDWYLNGVAQGVTSTTFTPANITAETTVQVSYEAIQYTITYHNLGDADNSSNPTTYTIEDDLITLEDISYDGYHFHYWANHPGMTYRTNTIAAHSHGNKDFYAKWGYVTGWNWSGDPTPSAYASARTYTTKTEITAEPLLSYEYNGSSQRYTRCYTLMNAAGDAAVSRQPEFTVNTSSATHFGEVTFIQPIAGTYRLKVELKAYTLYHDNCESSTLAYAISDQFVVENVHKITLKYVSDGVEICPKYELEASNSALAPTTTRADLASMGYTFHHWEKGSNITLRSGTLGNESTAGSASITYTASADEVLTEVYKAGGIYFKNTVGWSEVYVCLHNNAGYWDSGTGSGSSGKTFAKMTKLKESDSGDIYYYATAPTNGHSVAFSNRSDQASKSHFDNGEIVYRFFNDATPMCIPVKSNDTDYKTINGAHYVRSFWAKYNPFATGYELKVYNQTKIDGATLNYSIPFGFGDDGKTLVAVANLEGNKTLGFRYTQTRTGGGDAGKWQWWRDSNNGTMTYGNSTDWTFYDSNSDYNCGLTTKTSGDYKFIISSKLVAGTTEDAVQGAYSVSVEYPAKDGDYRLYYMEGTPGKSSYGNTRAASWYHESDAIPQETLLNYREVYINPAASPTLTLQQYTASTNTWANVTPAVSIVFEEEYTGDADIDALNQLPEAGVYTFLVNTKTTGCAEGKEAECFCVKFRGKYDGDFYIRTDGVDNYKWDYKKSMLAHRMTYSEYSKTLSKHPFSHYYVKDLDAGTNVRFTVATENTSAICDTLYHQDAEFNLGSETLPAFANVRFMYDEATNHISRSFIGASNVNSFLNVRSLHSGSKIYKEWTSDAVNTPPSHASLTDDAATYDVDTIKFNDNGNWIYEADVYAKPGATIKLTSKYSSLATQFFKGKSGAYNVTGNVDTLIGGTGTKAYPIKMIYDFKINRLTTAWVPSALENDLAINADLMIVREHQQDAEQIDLGTGEGSPFDLTKVKTVYGVMQFNKWTVNNKSKAAGHADLTGEDYLNESQRGLYWISFPFDVNLIDVFGFGEYGKHWIIEYYDGKTRAKNGFWIDSESNWKFVETDERNSYVLKANMGYVLALDLDEMGTSSDIWTHVEDVYLYFPSTAEVSSIESTSKTVNFPDQSEYECKITRNKRYIKDSYWHCIGVPSFANASHAVFNDTDEDEAGDWAPGDLMYLYEWNSLFNTLIPVDTKGKYGSAGSFNFKAMYSYLVQYSNSTMVWTSVVNHPDPSPVVKRMKKATEMENADFRLELFKDEQKQDQAFICLTEDERVSTAFEFNYDLCKENNAGKGNIWTITSDSIPVAGNVLPVSNQTTIVPVGIKTPSAGEYTIAIPEGTSGVGVVLIDNYTGARTNLALTDYTVTLAAGQDDARFVLEISPISQTTTSVENTGAGKNNIRKMMVDGMLYIIKDGKVFDARGNRVK